MGIALADRSRLAAAPAPSDLAANLAAFFPVASGGLVRHVNGTRLPKAAGWDSAERTARVDAFRRDARLLAAAFDRRAEEVGLGVRMDVDALCEAAGRDARIAETYHADAEHGGRIHPNQLETAVEVMARTIAEPRRSVLVLGALQSGKTGTGLCLQFLGPVAYLLTGVRTYPFMLLPNQISHETQTRREFSRFLTFYGPARFVLGDRGCTLVEFLRGASPWDALAERPVAPADPALVSAFATDPSIDTYRRTVVPEAGADPWSFLDPRDAVRRRMPVGGSAGRALKAFVTRLVENGIVPLPIVDETQYGASDRIVEDQRRPCVLAAVLDLVEQATSEARDRAVMAAYAEGGPVAASVATLTGLHGPRRAILLSASPYGLVDARDGRLAGRAGLAVVAQRLPPDYSGINAFMGLPIDPAASVAPPRVLDFREAAPGGDAFLHLVDMPMYFRIRAGADPLKRLRSWAKRHRLGRDHFDPRLPVDPQAERYCQRVEEALRAFLVGLLRADGGTAADGTPRGVCVRFGNANAATFRLLMRLRLEDEAEVLRFCDKVPGGDVKGFLRASRREPDRPFLIAVTNRARMGDAFPRQVDTFVEYARRASDLNALLQGLLGRACGIGKASTVIMSPANAALVRGYLARHGEVTSKASRHVVPLGPYPVEDIRAVATLRYGAHPAIDRVLDRFNEEVASKVLSGSGARVQDRSTVDAASGRFLPLYAIADEEGVIDLIERQPGLAMEGAGDPVRILRPGQALAEGTGLVRHFACPDRPGWVHVGFRSGQRRNRATGRLRGIGSVVEPHAFIEPGTPARVTEIELPLARPVASTSARGVGVAIVEAHVFDRHLSPVERMERDIAADAAENGWA